MSNINSLDTKNVKSYISLILWSMPFQTESNDLENQYSDCDIKCMIKTILLKPQISITC